VSVGSDEVGDAVISPDSNRNESGAVAYVTADTDFVVGGVEEELGDLGQRVGAPLFELLIEGGGKVRDPGGGDFEAAELSDDLGDASGASPPNHPTLSPPSFNRVCSQA